MSYPTDAFHTQEFLNGPKEVLTISLSFFLCCSERDIKLKGRICLLEDKLGFRQQETGLVNRPCPRIERNAYVSRHMYIPLSCISATLFYLFDENYSSTGSVCV